MLTVVNESPETLRFQVSAFAWSQGPKGEIQLAPTSDVTFFPSLLSIEAGKEAKVRVGLLVAAGPVERTYRIFFEELKPAEKPDQPPGSQVRVLTKMGIPIFVEPVKESWGGKLEGLGVAARKLRFAVRNTGNVHFSLLTVHVVGSDKAGAKLLDQQVEGWYVLPGGVREYEIDLSQAECAALRVVAIEAKTDKGMLTARGDVSGDGCPPAPAK
jgi:fimbrial chaperone protein